MIIALSGKRRSGKDTVAEILQRKYGAEPIKLVGRMKQMVREFFSMGPEHIEGDLKEVPLENLFIRLDTGRHEGTPATPLESYIFDTVWRHAHDVMAGGGEVTPRDLMIWAGNLGRDTSIKGLEELDPLYWAKRSLDVQGDHEGKCLVITDLSFKAEFEYLYKQRAYPVRIERSAELRGSDGTDPRETDLDDEHRWVDHYYNDGTLEELEAWAVRMYDRIPKSRVFQ